MESLTSLGTTRFLTLNGTRVASYEACSTKCGFVFCVDFHQSASDAQTKSLCLSGETTTYEVYLNIIFLGYTKKFQRLLNDKLEDRIGEI